MSTHDHKILVYLAHNGPPEFVHGHTALCLICHTFMMDALPFSQTAVRNKIYCCLSFVRASDVAQTNAMSAVARFGWRSWSSWSGGGGP